MMFELIDELETFIKEWEKDEQISSFRAQDVISELKFLVEGFMLSYMEKANCIIEGRSKSNG